MMLKVYLIALQIIKPSLHILNLLHRHGSQLLNVFRVFIVHFFLESVHLLIFLLVKLHLFFDE